jgi:hypothetical protein
VLRLAGVEARIATALRAEVSIEQLAETAWRLRLVTNFDGMSGERVIEGKSCRAVADAAALTLALILNPDVHAPSANPAAASPPAMPRRPPEHDVLAPQRPAERATPGPAFGVAALGGVQGGTLPSPGPEFATGIGVSLSALSAWLLGSYGPRQDAPLSDGAATGGRVWFGSAGALTCWTPSFGQLRAGACAGGELSRVQGVGIGVTEPRHGVIYWVSPALGPTLMIALNETLAVSATVLALKPLTRPSLYLHELGTVHRPAEFAIRGRLGVVLEFR